MENNLVDFDDMNGIVLVKYLGDVILKDQILRNLHITETLLYSSIDLLIKFQNTIIPKNDIINSAHMANMQ